MAARVMVFRHANKEGASLSSKGINDALDFGKNLPESMRGFKIVRVGGSRHIRSVTTALLVAMGAGVDECFVLESEAGLGSFEKLSSIISDGELGAAIKANGGNNIVALRSVLGDDDCDLIKKSIIYGAISATKNMAGDHEAVLLGTHSPFLEMLYEHLLEINDYSGAAKELDYIVIDVSQDGGMKLIETNLE